MADRYTTQYNPTLQYGSAQLDDGTSHIALPGIMGGRVRYKVSTFTTDESEELATDTRRLFSVKSSDIMISFITSSVTGVTAAAGDYGFLLPDGGGVVRSGSASCITTGFDHAGGDVNVDLLLAGDAGKANVGFANWQWAGFTADPVQAWELAFTWSGAVTGTDRLIVHELQYVAT